MRITDVRCTRLEGTIDADPDAYYEDRLATPLDVYDEFREGEVDASGGLFPEAAGDELAVEGAFLRVETDAGTEGLAGPIDRETAYLALRLSDILVGRDPLSTERLWDLLYRRTVHGRTGRTTLAISAIDCALWDLKGKHYGEPVHRLLGGPTRERLPAYASMLWFPTDPDGVAERVREFADRGYDAQKWFFRHGPGSGREGVRENVALVEAAREAAGDGYDLMFDAWGAWDRTYALEMVDRLAPYGPAWVEEPVGPDAVDAMAEVTAAAPFPIAGGEHEYTRWGFHRLLERDALDVVQPDPLWAGGISEARKVCTLASARDVPVFLHGISVPACVHVSAAQPPTVCPRVEYLVRPNEALQHFLADPIEPDGGAIEVPDRPGLGIEIDPSKVESKDEIELG